MFSLQVKQREGNLPYQYLRKNNFRTKKGKYFIFNTLVTTYTQETVFVSISAANKREKRQDKHTQLAPTPKAEMKGKWKLSWVNKSVSGKAYGAKRRSDSSMNIKVAAFLVD